MRTEKIKKSLCVLCLSLSVVVGAVAMAQNQIPSILDRVQKVEDPELGELIRVAVENLKARYHTDEEMVGKKIKEVTQSYAQIRLLDQQIAEVTRKAKLVEETGPGELRYELLLAKTELESKRMTEIANLREMMFIIPKLPQAAHND